MTTSIELIGLNSLGLMMPICGTYSAPATPVYLVSLRMVVVGASPQPEFPAQPRQAGSPVPAKQIEVYLDGARRNVPLYRRADLGHGHRFGSPCVVAQEDTTTCVPEGFTGEVDAYGNILLTLDHVPVGQ